MVTNRMGGKILILGASLCVSIPQQIPPAQADQQRLAAILKRSAEYCQRLERAALDFVCLEEVTELSANFTPTTRVYLYDYQFIRKNKETKEKRNLIGVDGEKKDIQDSPLETVMFRYENVLFGPVGLLSGSWQGSFDYRIIGEDTVHKVKTVVIEATPVLVLIEPHPYGKIWVKEEDGSVLKIVWDQRSIGNYRTVKEWAEIHDAAPQITAFSEYGLEKNGLRFPSLNYSEQAYVRKGQQTFVSARLSIIYKKYKFFTVETEVKYDRP
jgi:hypothetical protein